MLSKEEIRSRAYTEILITVLIILAEILTICRMCFAWDTYVIEAKWVWACVSVLISCVIFLQGCKLVKYSCSKKS